MNPQSVRSRAVRCLRRLAKFRFVEGSCEVSVGHPLSSDVIGEFFDLNGKLLFAFTESELILDAGRTVVPFSDMKSVGLLQRSAVEAKTIKIEHVSGVHFLEILSSTGRYKDIFEVDRFLMRCAEDAELRKANGSQN